MALIPRTSASRRSATRTGRSALPGTLARTLASLAIRERSGSTSQVRFGPSVSTLQPPDPAWHEQVNHGPFSEAY